MNILQEEAYDMKPKSIIEAVYTGDIDNKAFIAGFQEHLLRTLKKRGLLTDRQLEKSLSILKEYKR
jgi:hypothetical protein